MHVQPPSAGCRQRWRAEWAAGLRGARPIRRDGEEAAAQLPGGLLASWALKCAPCRDARTLSQLFCMSVSKTIQCTSDLAQKQ